MHLNDRIYAELLNHGGVIITSSVKATVKSIKVNIELFNPAKQRVSTFNGNAWVMQFWMNYIKDTIQWIQYMIQLHTFQMLATRKRHEELTRSPHGTAQQCEDIRSVCCYLLCGV